jgi:transcription-repair coupling factor (superfamily II helicase)
MLDTIRHEVENTDAFHRLIDDLRRNRRDSHSVVGGVSGSLSAFVFSSLARTLERQLLIITPDLNQAEQLTDDLGFVHGDSARLFGAAGARRSLSEAESAHIGDMATLRSLADASADIVVCPAEAIGSRLPDPAQLGASTILLDTKTDYVLSDLITQLEALGFERRDFVGAAGEYSLRGGILDVFSHSGEYPIRAEFFGDTIESMREFDPLSQRSIRDIAVATVLPDVLKSDSAAAASATLFNYVQDDSVIIIVEPEILWQNVDAAADKYPDERIRAAEIRQLADRFARVHLNTLIDRSRDIDFQSLAQPSFNGSIRLLRRHLLDMRRAGMRVFIACDGQTELRRLRDLVIEYTPADPANTDQELSMEEREELLGVEFVHHALHNGFSLPLTRLACFTEHQIFGRQKRRGRKAKQRVRGFSAKEVQQLRKGDYVVHKDFGIGRFDGLKKIQVRGVEQEVMKVLYEENDTLYVNLNYLTRVQKYSSRDGHIPRLTRLGSTEWERLKARAKKRIQDIARDLIQLYARRKSSPGYAFQPDTPWQKELEASFMYEDTFDQAKATLDVKRDMEQQFPMDRLVCGDVGFGKTEVAVRAAFKAVLDGKQVGVLVPTTILALQHYHTFLDRTSPYTTRVAVISRLKSKKEQTEILAQLKAGSVDIIIGTHRLLSKDVHFKDLGLLIVDEEHRFGVAAKEKLRQLRATVDTLTLTATPIPRTLHFSLMGARDLSIIATPPRNRLPISTEIAHYSDDLVRDAVTRELARGGQVYFVHDRISDIEMWAGKLRELMPSVRMRHAHGQMHAHELEDVMLEFQEKRIDLLVCTKIIESGLDIPNVNTIIINRADRFGMSELYQLKGRVGRSNQQAYAYLLVPPISSLPTIALQRLKAIEEFTELGSGLSIAMRDLEIRGAGNLLGAEQSGFIESMGFETYTRILDEAVGELKETEFKELFPATGEPIRRSGETLVEVDLDALIPSTYVENDTERLELYRRLYSLTSHAQLSELGGELRDRFGPLPDEVQNLLDAVHIRLTASDIGFAKAWIRKGSAEMEFPPEADIEFYASRKFQILMSELSHQGKKGVFLKQEKESLKLMTRFSSESHPLRWTMQFLGELQSTLKIGESSQS